MIPVLQFTNFKLVTLLIALVVWHWRGNHAVRGAWIITTLFTLELVVEFWAAYLALGKQRNHWLYNCYFPLEIGLWLLFFSRQWGDRRFGIGLWVGLIAFSAVYIWECLGAFQNKAMTYAAYITETLVIILLTSALLIRGALIGERSPARDPLFWLLFSTVFFFGGMLPLMGLLEIMSVRNPTLWTRLFIINDILFHLRFALVAVPLLFLPKSVHT